MCRTPCVLWGLLDCVSLDSRGGRRNCPKGRSSRGPGYPRDLRLLPASHRDSSASSEAAPARSQSSNSSPAGPRARLEQRERRGKRGRRAANRHHQAQLTPLARTFLSTTNSFSAAVRLLISSSYLPERRRKDWCEVRAWEEREQIQTQKRCEQVQ